MPDEPSVKGVVLDRSWTQLNRLLDEGRVSRDELEVRLEQRDLDILDRKIEPALWYPAAVTASFAEIVGDVDGHEGPSDWIENGFGIVSGGRAIPAADVEGTADCCANAGDALLEAVSQIVDAAEIAVECTLDAFRVRVAGADALPEVVRYTLHGVILAVAERVAKRPVKLESRRSSAGVIVFSGATA